MARPNASDARRLALVAGLGTLSALWSLFLWMELVLSRSGGTPFCALGEGANCSALWDGTFATFVHRTTGLPVAALGLAWSAALVVSALSALQSVARGDPPRGAAGAVRILAVVGLVTAFGLATVSVVEQVLCLGCLGTYAVVLAIGVVELGLGRGRGPESFGPGIVTSGVTLGLSALVLLYPGLKTPSATRNLDAIRAGAAGVQNASAQNPSANNAPGLVDPAVGGEVGAFIATLPAELRQGISDSLHIFKESKAVATKPPRSTIGGATSGIRITDFTDSRCGHCAKLHAELKEISKYVPPGSFHLEPRHFPLDGACNPAVQRRAPDPASCIAAKSLVCLEGSAAVDAVTSALFEQGQNLTSDKVYELVTPHLPRAKLDACIADPATQNKINDDVAWAMEHELEGTPLVLINGRKGTSFGPFLFAMILAQGNPDHPGFAGLPQANPAAHMH